MIKRKKVIDFVKARRGDLITIIKNPICSEDDKKAELVQKPISEKVKSLMDMKDIMKRKVSSLKIGMVSLGCTKNLVDSEVMLGLLKQEGYAITPRSEDAEIIIINTCSFIEPAKREAVDTILEMADLKKDAQCRFLIVTGCLAQEFGKALTREIPEIDALIGPGEMGEIVTVVRDLEASASKGPVYFLNQSHFLYDHTYPRLRTTCPHLAYIKISEGCDHVCSYCLIPKLRGRYRSRTSESILNEAECLIREGVKEICLIGQDTTAFKQLHILLEKLALLKARPWVRLLYTYPFSVTHEMIQVMARYPNILSYLDIPLQHSHPRILKAMNRHPTDLKQIETLIDFARSMISDLVIRTTFMVGFPGETEEEFEHLLQFAQKIRFDRLGVFMYSKEKGTPASRMPNQIGKSVKNKRYQQMMTMQAQISKEKNQAYLGKIVDVICDYPDPVQKGIMIGRMKGQAPQIDGITFIEGKDLRQGYIYQVKITDTDVYDLKGIRIT